jgi:hypothetical protein
LLCTICLTPQLVDLARGAGVSGVAARRAKAGRHLLRNFATETPFFAITSWNRPTYLGVSNRYAGAQHFCRSTRPL